MAKKSTGSLNILYFLGMLVAAVGFCLPMFTSKVLGSSNGFKFIDFDRSGFVTIGALLLFVGACLGALIGLLSVLRVKVPSKKLLALIAIIVVLVGAIVLVVGFMTGSGIQGAIYKEIGKGLFKHATYGFYMVIAGWVVSVVGYIL